MQSRTLLNLDAFLELVVGLALLMNGLLGPRFPFGPPIAAVLGVVFLVSAVVLGRGGMGKGALVGRLGTVGMANFVCGVGLAGAALGWLHQGARVAALIVGAAAAALGIAQLLCSRRPPSDTPQIRRATPAELRAAIGHRPLDDRPDDSRK